MKICRRNHQIKPKASAAESGLYCRKCTSTLPESTSEPMPIGWQCLKIEMQVPCVASGVFTRDLILLCEWLKRCQVETIVMESTGVYWIPLYQMLERKGFEVRRVT